MEWIHWDGLIVMGLIMVPNLIFAWIRKDGFENRYQNKIAECAEQIGRSGCFGLMVFSIPPLCTGFWFDHAQEVFWIVNGVLTAAYCLIWILFWNRDGLFKSLALSILPSLIFLFSGVVWGNPLLVILSVLFAACHITISYQNAV